MTTLLYRRPDGSFVAIVNGLPFHVTEDNPTFAAAQVLAGQMGDELPFEPAPTAPAVTIDDYENSIQAHIDTTARNRQFRDGVTLASYATSTIPAWAAEAQAFIAWRDAVWTYCYSELAKVQGGLRGQPTVADFVDELIPIVWPL
ncbi:hypothetical protein [Rhizobium laguerreae]|uniref:hypothetical protein n=1 Tax=Rhizobium laguerreae TaxID=1076926 RepID=UPI001440FD05|nr:hypothetical protein [Rhizobium laguerreae]NKM30777.1 hypothetical protein [Rhizobium laguerreae]